MKQFQAEYRDRDSFRRSVADWNAWRAENPSGQVLVHILSDGADEAEVRAARDIVEQMMPEAAYIGASASGIIYEGNITRISHIQEAVKDGTTATRQNYKVYASIQADEQIRAGMTVILSIDTGNAAAEEPAGETETVEEAPAAE